MHNGIYLLSGDAVPRHLLPKGASLLWKPIMIFTVPKGTVKIRGIPKNIVLCREYRQKVSMIKVNVVVLNLCINNLVCAERTKL